MALYTLPFKTQVTNAIEGLNDLPFPLTDEGYNQSNPIELNKNPRENTKATLRATGVKNEDGKRYTGSVEITYTRLDLGVLFKGINVRWETEAVTTSPFGEYLANVYGIPVTKDDILDEVIPESSSNSYIVITASPSSLWLTGNCTIYCSRGKPDIGDLVNTDWESGIYDPLPPIDANYALTYPHDYTESAEVLKLGGGTLDDSLRLQLWGITMGSRPSQWDKEATGIIYAGEDKVVAAGGRPGFKYLLTVPRLNIWAHFND